MIVTRAKPMRMLLMAVACDGGWGRRYCVGGRRRDVPAKVMPSWTSR